MSKIASGVGESVDVSRGFEAEEVVAEVEVVVVGRREERSARMKVAIRARGVVKWAGDMGDLLLELVGCRSRLGVE